MARGRARGIQSNRLRKIGNGKLVRAAGQVATAPLDADHRSVFRQQVAAQRLVEVRDGARVMPNRIASSKSPIARSNSPRAARTLPRLANACAVTEKTVALLGSSLMASLKSAIADSQLSFRR